ncbi:dicarboxylic amino acid permease [Colletotrichum musicola]|uniref:Dicarboxylic amino acid permease n=1 Tax=Colletotrichum musicola TaxID=2175873 RepID=A0A8H6J1N3_9PEZI|nr:dicarboxylic amino acid permease [Colletotrichum musicola]
MLGTVSNVEGSSAETGQLKREFKERHVSMIAVAGAIGTGLVIGSGTGLVRGGPPSLLIAYSLIGAVVFFIMTAVGEMATMLPSDKGFAGYATRFVDPALGYATGWNYFLKYAIVLPNNLTAAGIIIQYWRPDLNVAIFVITFTVVIVGVNLPHVSFFGEAEFWMSAVKLLVITMLVLTCFIISMGGQPSGEVIGFKYWANLGAFGSYLVEGPTGRFLGFWAATVQACFAYTGTEVVGVAFGEAPNPRRTIRKAVRQTLWRIVFFYVLGVLVLGMSVPYTNGMLIGGTKKGTGAAASPAANSDIYIGSRTLFGLARDGQAPGIISKTTGKGVPIYGVAITSVFAVLAYMNAAKSSSQVFGYLVSLVTVFGTLNWVSVLLSYIQFTRGMKAQGIPRSMMPYRGPLQPYGSYKVYAKTKKVELHEMDLYSNRLEDDGNKYPGSLEKAALWVLYALDSRSD